MNQPEYYFMIEYKDGENEIIKVSKKLGYKMLEELTVKEQIKFIQLVRYN